MANLFSSHIFPYVQKLAAQSGKTLYVTAQSLAGEIGLRGQVWREVMRIFIGFLIGFLTLSQELLASDDAWERLDDGRVVIEVGNDKFAFTTEEHDLASITFGTSGELVEEWHKLGAETKGTLNITLGEVLENPAIAKKAFKNAVKNEVAAMPRVIPPTRFWKDGKNVPVTQVQGKFDPYKLARASSGHMTFWLWQGPVYAEHYTEGDKKWRWGPCNEGVGKSRVLISDKDEYGFQVVAHKKGSAHYYCLPSSQRSFETNRDLRIRCSSGLGKCEAWFYGKHERITVGYAFDKTNFPQSEWIALDGRMHAYFSNFLLTEELE